MNTSKFDELDELIINILGKNPQSAQDINEKVKKFSVNKSPAVIWSRLIKLVEEGYLDIIHAGTEQEITMFKIRNS